MPNAPARASPLDPTIFEYCYAIVLKSKKKNNKGITMNTEKENLTARIPVRCTAAQKELINAKAEFCGLSTSEYLRRLGIGDQIEAKADLAAIGQLNRFGGLLKHMYSTSQGAHSADTKKALDQVNQLLKKMLEAD
jgi:hypothetical protein